MTRSEGDTWDLASSVGATATSVAASRALATRQPDPLIVDPFAEPLVKAVGLDFCNRVADGDIDLSDDPLFSRDHMCEQIAVRTRFFDDFFADAGAAGVRQAVILASGLDTRAYRLTWPGGTTVFEIDQPEVIEFKTRVLADLGAAPSADRRTVGIDLRDDWPKALREAVSTPRSRTAWIAEGLLIYLPPDAQDRLLDNITALSAAGQPARDRAHEQQTLTGDWAEKLTERARRIGQHDRPRRAVLLRRAQHRAATISAAHGWQVERASHRRGLRRQGIRAAGRRMDGARRSIPAISPRCSGQEA